MGVGVSIALAAGISGPTAEAAAPACEPTTINRTDVLPGTSLDVSPLPDSMDASPGTQISFVGAPPSSLSQITVTGSRSGRHGGVLQPYSQGDGESFVPNSPFLAGEQVTVHGRVTRGASATNFTFHFVVETPDPLPYPTVGALHPSSSTLDSFHSMPNLDAPKVTISTDSPSSAPGYLFAALYGSGEIGGPLIFDNTGQPVWFDPLPHGVSATDLRVQQLGSQPVLTWWQGGVLPQGFGEGQDMIANSAYQVVQVVHAGNGDSADLHDFELQPDNVALVTVYKALRCDLSGHGGSSTSAVTDSGFQEIDLKTGLVRREWDSLDHVPLSYTETTASGADLTWPFDFFHLNSLDAEPDGNLLMSARNTWAIYTINRTTGRVLATIGGNHGTYKEGRGAGTAYQHDATLLPNGTISVFDNGGTPVVHPQSRALILGLDTKTNTIRRVAQYTHRSPLKSGSQGDVQVLANGDVFVGWGGAPYFSEYTTGGKAVFDGRVSGAAQSYRVYRFPWTGTPAGPPAIAATAGAGGRLTVYASWNGATQVAAWRVLAGASPSALARVASVARTGFETTIATPSAGPDVEVQALGSAGQVLGTSKLLSSP
ncbi:MAG TPA: arylsulfotransferase family protein [Solirubrobacteraceae bacterium]|jgi:hypothetical protein|nr:arylsulfotransferase family protein [Solirubrobacteraceae bacterium]